MRPFSPGGSYSTAHGDAVSTDDQRPDRGESMKPLALDALPAHSEWARYLLDPHGDPPDDPEAYTTVDRYDAMYEHLLSEYRRSEGGLEAFTRRVSAAGQEDPGPVSIHESLYLCSPAELLELERFAVGSALRGVPAPDTVLDLGCGWGAALAPLAETFPETHIVGGERSDAGVELARELHADRDRISVEPFDFEASWDLLDRASDETLVFTRGVLTTVPDPATAVDRLAARAVEGSLVGGVHLEPVDEHPETTLGLLRRHYGRCRGYDGSALAALRAADGIAVDRVEYDALGANPLHPATAVRWRPR
jgi:SAM-dependent methyltransferase